MFELPFGKYKGKTLEETPKQYLHWLSRQDWLVDPTFTEVFTYLGKPVPERERQPTTEELVDMVAQQTIDELKSIEEQIK